VGVFRANMAGMRTLPKSAKPSTHTTIARLGAVAAAALLCMGQAQALNLGRIQVRSALGEPLRAEVEVLNFTPAQAASLQLGVTPATAYSSFGQANNALANDFKATLVLDDKGQASIRLNSSRVIDAPFVDFVLEANWAAGRSVRDYTMLFDAPSANGAAAARTPLVSASISAAQPASAGQAHVVKPGETKKKEEKNKDKGHGKKKK